MRISLHRRLLLCLSLLGLVLWMLIGSVPLAAFAAEGGVLKLICKTADGVILEGMHWELFLVGGRDANGDYVLQGEFAGYHVSLADTSASGLTAAAETLENYAVIDNIAPIASADADENGLLQFPMLQPGLYLAAGDFLRIGDVYYFPSAFLIEVPEDGSAVFDMTAYPKYISMNAGEGGLNYTVKKIWENDETEIENRSVYIEVALYRNDEFYQTVILNEANDWTYAWSADHFYQWRVIEVDVPEGYDVVYRSNETQYVIVNTFTSASSITETNSSTDSVMTETVTETDSIMTGTTANSESVPSTNMTDGTEPGGSENRATGSGMTTTTVTTEISTDHEDLPQTGQLWWPVPVLGVAGLLAIAVGVRLITKE